jgi:hypothetical protein
LRPGLRNGISFRPFAFGIVATVATIAEAAIPADTPRRRTAAETAFQKINKACLISQSLAVVL